MGFWQCFDHIFRPKKIEGWVKEWSEPLKFPYPDAPWCWKIFLHLPQKSPSYVGKYSIHSHIFPYIPHIFPSWGPFIFWGSMDLLDRDPDVLQTEARHRKLQRAAVRREMAAVRMGQVDIFHKHGPIFTVFSYGEGLKPDGFSVFHVLCFSTGWDESMVFDSLLWQDSSLCEDCKQTNKKTFVSNTQRFT